MSVAKLKKELEAKVAAKREEIAQLIESKKVEMEIAKLESPIYTLREIEKEDQAKLDAILTHIEETYAAEGKKLSRTFGYGITVNKVMTILKAIQYSKAEAKIELLMMTGLDEQVVEDTIDAFGSNAYFSVRGMTIVEEQPMDITKVKDLLLVVTTDLGLLNGINLSKINPRQVEYFSMSAKLRAEEMLENTLKYNVDAIAKYEE